MYNSIKYLHLGLNNKIIYIQLLISIRIHLMSNSNPVVIVGVCEQVRLIAKGSPPNPLPPPLSRRTPFSHDASCKGGLGIPPDRRRTCYRR
jgi:hypothetical protein